MVREPLPTQVLSPDAGPRPPDIPLELQVGLLEIARATLAVAVRHADPSTLDRLVGKAGEGDLHAGVFVTLKKHGQLRGCIGTIDDSRWLRGAVVSATLGAALGDPRFPPVTGLELPALDVGISILGRAVALRTRDDFMPGVDGVIVERGGRRALLLPEVATEFAWGTVEMLEHACRKAGLPPDAWRHPSTSVSIFRTTRFHGPAAPSPRHA